MPTSSTNVLGTDGCPGGWIAVTAIDGRFDSLACYPDIKTLVEANRDAEILGIDIPLWFPAGKEHRPSDVAGKKALGRRSACLFHTPPRDILEVPDYAEANQLSKKLYNRGITRQAYGLRTKIFDAVGFLDATGDLRLREVHPEISFLFLARSLRKEVTASKKTWSGLAERLSLLQSVGLAPLLKPGDNLGRTAPDDVLDACVAAWTAYRIATRTAELIGADPGSASVHQPDEHPAVIYA